MLHKGNIPIQKLQDTNELICPTSKRPQSKNEALNNTSPKMLYFNINCYFLSIYFKNLIFIIIAT